MNIILLEVGTQLFGIDAERVVQVVEPPPATPIPFLPDHVDGLVNIGGAVIVSIDLARALGNGEAGEARVSMVVRGTHGSFALKVGRVLMMVPVEPAEMHPLEHTAAQALGEGVIAAEFNWRDRMVLMIDPDRFDLGDVDVETAAGSPDLLTIAGEPAAQAGTAASDAMPWLIVEIGGERYALDVHSITEVVEADSFLPVPKAPAEIMGFHALRGSPLLVVALARLLGVAACPVRHVVVVDRKGAAIGLGVGRVVGIRSFDGAAAEDVGDATGAVAGCLSNGDGGLLAVLDLDHVLTPETMAHLAEYMPKAEAANAAASRVNSPIRRVLTFWVGGELCGIDLDAVSRVAEFQPWSELPDDGGLRLSGVTQIGNDVMPVIDLRERRGRRPEAPPLAQVVTRLEGGSCALAVDRMHRIVDLPAEDIHALDDCEGDLVDAVGRADGHLISVLAVEHLLSERPAC